MIRRIPLVVAVTLALIMTAGATWAFARGVDEPIATNSAVLAFGAVIVPNVGDLCANFSGAAFGCDPPTPDYSTPMPRAGRLTTLVIHPIQNDIKTDTVIVVFVNNRGTALLMVIPAGDTHTWIAKANVSVAAGDMIKIEAQGFTSQNNSDRLQFTGSVLYEYP